MSTSLAKIGIFDSGLGGLSILKEIRSLLPQYTYVYLGDNARAPYGDQDFETIYKYTCEGVEWLFKQNCSLVILACNTASARALKNIQQFILPQRYPNARVLGVIRPTAECIARYTHSHAVGILATSGTVKSLSYLLEIEKFAPQIQVFQQACPPWVPLIENLDEQAIDDGILSEYLELLLQQSPDIDTVLLGCTHYPLIKSKLQALINKRNIQLVDQGGIVAHSLKDYLARHPELNIRPSPNASCVFYTTGELQSFNRLSLLFLQEQVEAQQVNLLNDLI